MFACEHCPLQKISLVKLLEHYRKAHITDFSFNVTCVVENCFSSYTCVRSLTKHIKKKHPEFYAHNTTVRPLYTNNETAEKEFDGDYNDNNDQLGANDGCPPMDVVQVLNPTNQLAMFLLSLKEKHKIPGTAISSISDQLNDIICTQTNFAIDQCSELLCEQNSDNQDVLNQTFAQLKERIPANIQGISEPVSDDRKLKKYINSHLNVILPIEFLLGVDDRGRKCSHQYVPILSTLKSLLCNESVYSEFMQGHKSDDGIMRDFCDGLLFSENILFSGVNRVLEIMLYIDEFQVVNPIGNRVHRNKVMGVYFLLGNLQPKYRSKLHVIQLCCLARSEDCKKFGLNVVLQPLLFDLQRLETEGIVIEKPDANQTFFGTVSVTIADNLGSHMIGGFFEAFNTLRICRMCMATKEEIQTLKDINMYQLRTKEGHQSHLDLINQNQALANIYGVKARSVLNDLSYFHVIRGLPFDIAHDLFEGVIPNVVQLVIVCLVDDGYITLSELNQKVETFPYAVVDKVNAPTKMSNLKANFKVKQSASQMWCLLRYLPLMLGGHVPEENQYWVVLIRLLCFVDYACMREVREVDIVRMRDSYQAFFEQFKAIFPNERITPKMHYIGHYPTQCVLFGPLIALWTLRFEGKHSYFKELARRTHCRKNMMKSLAMRHQYLQALHHSSCDFLSLGQMKTVGGSFQHIICLGQDKQNVLSNILNGEQGVFMCKAIVVDGSKYAVGCCIVRSFEDDYIQFGFIEDIVVVMGIPYLLCRSLETNYFDQHFHSFIVTRRTNLYVVKISDLLEFSPLGIHNIGGRDMVILKYNLVLSAL